MVIRLILDTPPLEAIQCLGKCACIEYQQPSSHRQPTALLFKQSKSLHVLLSTVMIFVGSLASAGGIECWFRIYWNIIANAPRLNIEYS